MSIAEHVGLPGGVFHQSGIAIRIVEETKLVFGFEDGANQVPDLRHGNLAFLQKLLDVAHIVHAAHVHVHPCYKTQTRHLFGITHAVVLHFTH